MSNLANKEVMCVAQKLTSVIGGDTGDVQMFYEDIRELGLSRFLREFDRFQYSERIAGEIEDVFDLFQTLLEEEKHD